MGERDEPTGKIREREHAPERATTATAPVRVQAKMTVGAHDDAYEIEADRVAAEVVSRLSGNSTLQLPPQVSRRADPALSVGPEGGDLDSGLESRIQSLRGGGSPLDPATRSSMESAIGADFGAVRVHEGGEATELSRSLGASAFTVGSDVFFQGRVPSGNEGTRLLAHELTHTLQQGGSARRLLDPEDARNRAEAAGTPPAGNGPGGNQGLVYQNYSDLPGGDQPDGYGTYSQLPDGDQPDGYGTYTQLPGGQYSTPLPGGHYSSPLPDGDEFDDESEGDEFDDESEGYGEGYGEGYDEGYGADYAENHDVDDIEAQLASPGAAKYTYLRSVDPRYAPESVSGSPDLPLIIDLGRGLVASGKFATIDDFMIKQFGWSAEDVERYIHKGEASKVVYLDEDQRKNLELNLGSTITQGDPPITFDTSKMFSKHSGAGFAIYVMAADGTMYADQHKVGLFHHSSFLSTIDPATGGILGSVAGAGEIKIIGGSVKVVSNKTGHYLAGDAELWQVLDNLKSAGINLVGVEVRNIVGKTLPWPNGDAQKFWEDMRPA